MSLGACNPKIGHGVSQVLADNYPERLGAVVCVNHNPVFQGVWNALRLFLHPSTTSKVHLVHSKAKVRYLRALTKIANVGLSVSVNNEIKT